MMMAKTKSVNRAIIHGFNLFLKKLNHLLSNTCSNLTSTDCLTCLISENRIKNENTGECLCSDEFYDGGESNCFPCHSSWLFFFSLIS